MGLKGMCRCFIRLTIFSLLIVAAIVLVPNLPPYCKISESFSVPKTRPLTGPLAINEKLKDVEIWHKGKFHGPEAFAEYNGELYTSLHGGSIVKFSNNQIITVAKTGKPCKGYWEEKICGRPLGFKFDKNGALYVADAYYGILKINTKTGQKEVIVSPDTVINGKKPKLFNSLVLTNNGDIYWSDSSTEFDLQNLIMDLLVDPTGRLIHYDAKTKKNKVLIDGLHFANGVQLSKDEDFVVVAESLYNRIHRYHLKGPRMGTHDVFVDGLPGLPDNIQRDVDDGFLITLVEPVNEDHPHLGQIFLPFPMVRKFLVRVVALADLAVEKLNELYPTEFGSKAQHFIGHYGSVRFLNSKKPYQMIVRVSKNGEITEALTTTAQQLNVLSDAFVFGDELYLGSPWNDYIGRIPLSKLGWETPKVKRSAPVEKPKAATTPKPTTTTPPPRQTTTTPKPQTTTTTPKPRTTPPPPPPTTTPKPQTTPPPPPKQATQPPMRKTEPPKRETALPKQQTPPPVKTTTPPPKQQTPPPAKATTPPPPKQQTPPPVKPTTPPLKQQSTPPPEPATQKTTPPQKPATTPPKQQTPSSKPSTAPPKQQTPPSKPSTAPPKQQSPPPQKPATPPPRQQTPPPKPSTAPPKQQTPPPQKPATPARQQGKERVRDGVKNEL